VNLGGYFDPLVTLLKHIVNEGFAGEGILSHHHIVATPEDAVETVKTALKAAALRDTI
jgi:predicted Rossmann-fold nucleotide-binding protein